MASYTALTVDAPRTLRLVGSSQTPDLTFHPGNRFHVYLGHLWSSGQVQTAAIKRKLQLLLPGIAVFLADDDLDDESNLAAYVEESQSFIAFLSKGYFFDALCLDELDRCSPSIEERREKRRGWGAAPPCFPSSAAPLLGCK